MRSQSDAASVLVPPRLYQEIPERVCVLDDYQAVNKVIPTPNTLYIMADIKGLKTFRTDDAARPVMVTGTLELNHGNRRGEIDAKIGQLGRMGDVGFHLAANGFGFPGGRLNVVPGNTILNNGAYYEHEVKLRSLARRCAAEKAQKRSTVHGWFRAHYEKDNQTTRPDAFVVNHEIIADQGPSATRVPLGVKVFLNKAIKGTRISKGPRPPNGDPG